MASRWTARGCVTRRLLRAENWSCKWARHRTRAGAPLPGACRGHTRNFNMKKYHKLLLGIWALASAFPALAETHFDRVFAPQDGLVSSYEKPARAEICLNGSWKFQADTDTSIPN